MTSHILTPYPGTEVYQRFREQGRIIDEDLSHYNTAHVVFQPSGMTKEELYEGYLQVYREVYSFKNILRRCPKSRKQRMPYFLFNFFLKESIGVWIVLRYSLYNQGIRILLTSIFSRPKNFRWRKKVNRKKIFLFV